MRRPFTAGLAVTGLAVTGLLAAGLVLAACSSTASTSAPTSAASAAASAAAPAPASAAAAGSAAVAIRDFAFAPGTVTVAPGSTVTWTNGDGAAHTVTFDDGTGSGKLASGATFSRTFDAPGTYAYVCSIHSSMKGEVVVK